MSNVLFPGSLALAVFGAWAGLDAGVDPALLPVVATAVALVVVLAAERWLPRVGRPTEAGELRTDLGFVGLTVLVADPLSKAALVGLLAAVAGWLPPGPSGQLPLAVGVVGVLVAGGLGDYWAHRLGHEWSWWWRLHAVHHAPHRMTALNNFRIHPADLLLKVLFASIPVLLLGFSSEAIGVAGVIRGLNIAFQHADADLRHGPLNLIFSTNSVHRWHHSAEPEEANKNYGGVLSIFDLAFGTYRVPAEHLEPERMGLFDETGYPVHGLRRSIAAPLCWRRCVVNSAAPRSRCTPRKWHCCAP